MKKLSTSLVLAATLFASTVALAQQKYPGVGRAATPAEIKAWDIDVRPDFKGLPAGSGSVQTGQQIWQAKCESCHGTFGESNEVFTPIAGGTNKKDMETGRVASLKRPDFPQRSTLMKLSEMSSLWDYINRAMPWNAPKSLSADEVYAVTAFVLSLGDIVPSDFVLSDKNIAEVQARLPNRNGLVKFMPMWDVRGKGDVTNVACMTNCAKEVSLSSTLPDHARNAHGNIAEQNRLVGAVRGTDTTKPPPPTMATTATTATTATAVTTATAQDVSLSSLAPAPAAASAATPAGVASAQELARKSTCVACHVSNRKLVGPSYADIAKKYAGDASAVSKLMDKVKKGGAGVWGVIPMPPHAEMSDANIKTLVEWALQGGK
ncbi:MAG: c-type cytochrome [Aeromicrobium sp.]|nr:c-type cytochrome [Burkholderiales bacterium]